MSLKAEITTALCTVSCALGIGYVMQSGHAAEIRYGSGEFKAEQRAPAVNVSSLPFTVRDMAFAKDGEIVAVESVILASADLDEAKDPMPEPAVSESEGDLDALHQMAIDPECALTAKALVAEEAIMNLMVHSPCHAGQPVTVSYADVSLDKQLSSEGMLTASIPGAGDAAHVRVSFSDGERITALTLPE